eukprot:s3736_g2.t1
MPWRSNIGVPFGNVSAENTSADVGFDDPGSFHDWDTGLVDNNLFGDPDVELPDLGDLSVEGSPEELSEPHSELNVDVISAGSTTSRKRPAPGVDMQHGVGIRDDLFFNMLRLQRTAVPKQAWEVGTMAAIFGKPQPVLPMPWMGLPTVGKRDSLQGLSPMDEPPERTASRIPFHLQRLMATRLAQTDDQLRAKAMRRLRDLVLADPSRTHLGRALLDSTGQLLGQDRISCVFADAFRSRATSTLVKRSMDYYKLAMWLEQHLNLQPMQLSENVIYLYLSFLRDSKAAPTSADAAVKAIWFMHSTAGIIEFNPGSFTSRITGVCRDMYMGKRLLKQAPALPASVVRALEEYALMTDSSVDSFFTNFILFCIYSSCRIGDASKMKAVEFSRHNDVFLVEASTSEAKNTNTMERRRILLPFAALGWGVFPNPWCLKWKMQLDEMKPDTIMPAFSEVSGQFLNRRITTAEANAWMKEVLVRSGLDAKQAAKFSTHSCKATLATWAGKFGGFSMDERRLLTHHMDASNVMPLTYSRDNLTALHSRLYRMIAAIRNGEFSPDDTNAARIHHENLDPYQGQHSHVEWSEEWAASESDVTDDESFQEGCHFTGGRHVPAEDIAGDKLLHQISMVVHCKRDNNTLWCGRKLTKNYRKWAHGDPDFSQLLICQQCDRAQV